MKKYLIKGTLALVVGAFFGSCSDDYEYVPLAQQKVQAFEEVFKEIYGDISPDQNWGFSDELVVATDEDVETIVIEEEVKASTRRAGTRAEIDVNGNEWDVVPEVTAAEAKAVYDYVNKVKSQVEHYTEFPSQISLKNYYVTQVWTGTDKYTTWQDRNSTPSILGSSKMNNLHIAQQSSAEIGQVNWNIGLTGDWIHINNFNASDNRNYNGNTYVKNGGTYNFAYHSSEDNNYHDKWIAIDGKYITDADGVNHKGKYYICFDFVSYPINSKSYFKVWVNESGVQDGTQHHQERIAIDGIYGTAQDLLNDAISTVTYNGHTYTVNSSWVFDGMDNPNMCIPANEKYTDWIIRLVPGTEDTHGEGGKDNTWDDISDDWKEVTNQSGRVFCEDLGQATREDLDYNDVVFDVRVWEHTHTVQPMKSRTTWTTTNGVKDAGSETTSAAQTNGKAQVTVKYYAEIEVLAAGGTIPLQVAGKEVHSLFNVGVTTMVNTRDGNSTAFGSYVATKNNDHYYIYDEEKDIPIDKKGTKKHVYLKKDIEKASDVSVIVNYSGNQVAELTSHAGKAPHKLFVPTGTIWTSERKPLDLAYPSFGSYVNGTHSQPWVNNTVPYYLYSAAHQGLSDMPKVIKTKTTSTYQTDIIATPAKTFGGSLTEETYTLNIDKFWPGDRIRFFGSGFSEESYISVTVAGDSAPIIDTQFTERNRDGSYPSVAYVEILVDEDFCDKLNNLISNGGVSLKVRGRSFTLSQIGRVQF